VTAPVDPPRTPSFAAAASWSAHITPSNSNADQSTSLTSFANPTLVKVTQNGSEAQIWTAAASPQMAGTTQGTYYVRGDWVSNQCYAEVEVVFANGALWYCNLPEDGVPAITYAIVEGEGTVYWNRGNKPFIREFTTEYCGANTTPCYTYSGSFDITVERLAATLTLTANKRAVTPNATVTFTAAVTPGAAPGGSPSIPFKISSWKWLADDGDTLSTGCPTSTGINPATCTYSPTKPGRMEVQALVNGVLESRSLRISVVPCLLQDSLADEDQLRRLWKDLVSAGNPNDAAENRREHGWVRLLLPAGEILDTMPFEGGLSTPCSWKLPSGIGAVGMPLAWGHGHEFIPQSADDPLPWNCPRDPSLPPIPAGHVRAGKEGPSDEDYAAQEGGNIPMYIPDKQGNLYRLPAPSESNQTETTWKYNDACSPLSTL
jgi:hypothetical protein